MNGVFAVISEQNTQSKTHQLSLFMYILNLTQTLKPPTQMFVSVLVRGVTASHFWLKTLQNTTLM